MCSDPGFHGRIPSADGSFVTHSPTRFIFSWAKLCSTEASHYLIRFLSRQMSPATNIQWLMNNMKQSEIIQTKVQYVILTCKSSLILAVYGPLLTENQKPHLFQHQVLGSPGSGGINEGTWVSNYFGSSEKASVLLQE